MNCPAKQGRHSVDGNVPTYAKCQDALALVTISGCCWDTLVPGLIRGAHLVHPGATVELVASMNEAGIPVEPDVNIEALIAHLAVDFRARIQLPELDAISMGLKYLVHDIQ